MNSHDLVAEFGIRQNISTLQNIFGDHSHITPKELGKYRATTILQDGVIGGGQHLECELHREIVTIISEGKTHQIDVWVLDNLSVNETQIISNLDFKILISDEPYKSDEFQANLANLELQSLIRSDTDQRQVYVQSQISTMDSIIALIHETKHFETIPKYTPEEIQCVRLYAAFKYQNDLYLNNQVERMEQIPDLDVCETISSTFSTQQRAAMQDEELSNLVKGARLLYDNESRTNAETWKEVKKSLSRLTPQDPDGHRVKKFLTTMNLSYARTINNLLGSKTVDARKSEIR